MLFFLSRFLVVEAPKSPAPLFRSHEKQGQEISISNGIARIRIRIRITGVKKVRILPEMDLHKRSIQSISRFPLLPHLLHLRNRRPSRIALRSFLLRLRRRSPEAIPCRRSALSLRRCDALFPLSLSLAPSLRIQPISLPR